MQATSVSGRHCRVSSDEAGYILEDLNSTNGTYFQGKRVSGSIRVALAEDDIIHLGSYALPASKVLASLDRSNASQLLLQTQEMVIGRGGMQSRIRLTHGFVPARPDLPLGRPDLD